MRHVDEIWLKWRAFAHRAASVQARLLLSIIYFTLVAPFAVAVRFRSNPMRAMGWHRHDNSTESEPHAARRQF
ncbi:MAG TPA: hypothetical protein VES20_14665 [Bryobacteraceae bacterium]|nr:hypothetical protein [Bryobacteraceae bacterium]